MNHLIAEGQMFRLSTVPLSKIEFRELMSAGRNGDLYESVRSTRIIENEFYGFYQIEGKPKFEIKLNETRLGIQKNLFTHYERIYLPVQGSSRKQSGKEEFIYVSESGFKKGYSILEFDEAYEATKLKFQYKRYGLFNGIIFNTINPIYKNQNFDHVWNWSCFSSDYIISTRGKLYRLN